MKKLVYTIGIALAFGFVSCDKTSETFDENKGSTISFEPKTVETRALINSVEDLHSSTLRVFDFWSGQASEPYINNTLVYQSSQWQYGTEATYYWKDGTHKFFSFTDALGTLNSSKVVSVSKTLTTAEENQTDLLYSQVFTSTAADWMSSNTATTPVPLTFKHLLSSVAIVVKNSSGTPVTLNSVSASIPNVGSASVNYSADTVAVTLGDVSAGTTPFISAAALSNETLASQDSVDVLAQAKMAAEDYSYYVIWPQEINEESPVTVDVSYTPDGAEEALVKTVSLPAATWEPGNKYLYVLEILPTGVVLTFKVLPWEKLEKAIDTSTGSINMSNVTWMNTKVKLTQNGDEVNTVFNPPGYAVYMYYQPYYKPGDTWTQYTANNGYYPAQGYFTVNYPSSGQFKIGLIPAYGETSVDESKYEIYIYNSSTKAWDEHKTAAQTVETTPGETITHDTIYFQVRAASGQDGSQYKAQVNIWFKPTGSGSEWVSAYSEVRANYSLIIPARN